VDDLHFLLLSATTSGEAPEESEGSTTTVSGKYSSVNRNISAPQKNVMTP